MKYELKIGHLFSDLLNMFGDAGNIASLVKRMEWRGYSADVVSFKESDDISFEGLDIVILGGGGEKDEAKALEILRKKRNELSAFVENGGVLLALCGGFKMLGNFFETKNERVTGLEILDMDTSFGERFIGNVVCETEIDGKMVKIAGFENHGARTKLNGIEPFFKVLSGNGNNGKDKTEGAVYKNVFGTYLHGPLLPKNPVISDMILKTALEKKYGEKVVLLPLDDKLENEALEYVIEKLEV